MTKSGCSSVFVANGRLRSGWRVTLYLCAYLVIVLVTQIPLGVAYGLYLALRGADVSELQYMLRPEQLPLWLYLALKAAELVLLLPLTYAMARWLDRRTFADLGFHRGRSIVPDLALGQVLAGVQIGIAFAITWAGGWLTVAPLEGPALAGALTDTVLAFALFFLVALGEELIYRGYVQVNLAEGMPVALALVVCSVIFGVSHGLNPNFTWLGLLNIVLAGLVLGYARLVSGNLWLPIAYHFAWNYVQGAVLALPVSGVRFGGLLVAIDSGTAPWLTGGAFGPEGGLIGTVILVTSFPVLWFWGRRHRNTEIDR